MSPVEPRFEFRAWADQLDAVENAVRSLSECYQSRESTETYIISTTAVNANPKVRANQLDIKVLVAIRQGFEQWEPRLKATFPIPARLLRDELFPLLGQPAPALEGDTFSLARFLDNVVEPYDGIAAVEVTKRRRAFTISGCITEIADVSIAGAELQTAAVESVDIGALLEARRLTGLTAYDNVNYPTAIKRAIGWTVP
jgi:hypothetical protein